MKIAYLCSESFGGDDGIAQYNRDFAEALAEHELTDEIVMLPRAVRGTIQAPPEKVNFVWRAGRGTRAYLREVANVLPYGHELDLVICAHVDLLPYARMLSHDIVLIVHGVEAWTPRRGETELLLDDVRAVIAATELTMKRFQAWSGCVDPCYVVPGAVHFERFGIRKRDAAFAAHLGVEERHVVLLAAPLDRSAPARGADELLDVMPELIAADPAAVCVLAGTGNDVVGLQKRAAALGIADRVVFAGAVEETDRPALYSIASVAASPSQGLGFGFALVEALASGVPVVGSRLDGGYETLRGGMIGRVIDPTNQGELRIALLEAIDRKERRIPAGLQYFAFENFVSRVHSVVDQLLWQGEDRG